MATAHTGVSRFEDSQEKETLSYHSVKFSGLPLAVILQRDPNMGVPLRLPWVPAAQPLGRHRALKFFSDGGSKKLDGKESPWVSPRRGVAWNPSVNWGRRVEDRDDHPSGHLCPGGV